MTLIAGQGGWHVYREGRLGPQSDLCGILQPANNDSSFGFHLMGDGHLLLPLLESHSSLVTAPESCCIVRFGFGSMPVIYIVQPGSPGANLKSKISDVARYKACCGVCMHFHFSSMIEDKHLRFS